MTYRLLTVPRFACKIINPRNGFYTNTSYGAILYRSMWKCRHIQHQWRCFIKTFIGFLTILPDLGKSSNMYFINAQMKWIEARALVFTFIAMNYRFSGKKSKKKFIWEKYKLNNFKSLRCHLIFLFIFTKNLPWTRD